MRNVIFFDVDGVLNEWLHPFCLYTYKRGVNLFFNDVTGYNIENMPCWTSPSQCFQFIGDFANTDTWGNLPMLANPNLLRTLHNLGYELRVLSQVSSVEARPRRAKMLSKQYGPVFSGIHFTCHKQTKAEWLTTWLGRNQNPRAVLVDDKPQCIHQVALSHAVRLWPVGVNDPETQAYLSEEMDRMKGALKGLASFALNADAFMERVITAHYMENSCG